MFEAKASMLVDDENEEFPCKSPFVPCIKLAFDETLRKLEPLASLGRLCGQRSRRAVRPSFGFRKRASALLRFRRLRVVYWMPL